MSIRSIAACALFTFLVCGPGAALALGSWAWVPPEIMVDEADLIVVAKVVKITPGLKVDGQTRDKVELVVTKVLKDLHPVEGKIREQVFLHQAPAGGMIHSAMILHKVGQDGIWLLRRTKKDLYRADRHPGNHRPMAKLADTTKILAARKKIEGGKAVDGLSARAEVVPHETPAAGGRPARRWYEVRVSIKNTGKKPITICAWRGERHLKVDWKGPGDKAMTYKYLPVTRGSKLQKYAFMTIPPGGIRHINRFESLALYRPHPFVTAKQTVIGKGTHKLTVTYTNKTDGKTIGIKDVWKGSLVAPTQTIKVTK